jgi:calcium-dependent protein kinase
MTINLIEQEITILRKLDHHGIIKLHRVYEDFSYIYLVMDLVEGENLLELMSLLKNKKESEWAEDIR